MIVFTPQTRVFTRIRQSDAVRTFPPGNKEAEAALPAFPERVCPGKRKPEAVGVSRLGVGKPGVVANIVAGVYRKRQGEINEIEKLHLWGLGFGN